MEQRECFTDEEELNIYIDGELGNDRTMILNEHVRSCDDCSIRYRIASGLKSRVREACAEIRAPVWLRTRIMSDMERESAAGGGGFWVYLINRFRSRPLIPVGAVGLLVVLFLVAVFSNPRDGGTMPLVREMIHEHYEYMEGSLENGIFFLPTPCRRRTALAFLRSMGKRWDTYRSITWTGKSHCL
jgi:hypothetical protein